MISRNILLSAVFCLAVTFFICGCATIYNPATEKEEFIFINTQSEVSLGKLISKQVELQYPLSKDKKKLNRLNLIGDKIARVSDRQDLRYYLKVVKDKELNAFSLPGGFVYINSGLMEKADDDELACVIAHEIGHIAARHAIKKLQVALGYRLIISLALRNASSIELSRAVNTVYSLISLGYSREDERLSDRLAVKYAFSAKFNPEGMVTFFEKLKAEKKEKGLNYHIVLLESHPAVDERINNVKKEIELIKNKKIDRPKAPIIRDKVSSRDPKQCPICDKVYPAGYNFCTKDGTRLKAQ